MKIKTEHTGAKNGGGFWGRRKEAKQVSREQRRIEDKKKENEDLEATGQGANPV